MPRREYIFPISVVFLPQNNQKFQIVSNTKIKFWLLNFFLFFLQQDTKNSAGIRQNVVSLWNASNKG